MIYHLWWFISHRCHARVGLFSGLDGRPGVFHAVEDPYLQLDDCILCQWRLQCIFRDLHINVYSIYIYIYIIYIYIIYTVVKTIINHPIFDGLYHLFIVIWGIVYYCFNHITVLEISPWCEWISNMGLKHTVTEWALFCAAQQKQPDVASLLPLSLS